MKTKYVCHDLISLNVNFNDKRTMWTVILITKNVKWGIRKKSPLQRLKISFSKV